MNDAQPTEVNNTMTYGLLLVLGAKCKANHPSNDGNVLDNILILPFSMF